MGKAIGAVVRFALTLIVLAVVGYNTIQVAALRAEVAALRADPGTKATNATDAVGTLDLVASAQKHAERAQELLRRKQYGEAQREATLAVNALAKAKADAESGGRKTAAGFERALDSIRSLTREADGLWNRRPVANESEKK